MLALYIAAGIATYLGIGLKCASKSIDASIRRQYSDSRASSDACWAFFLWPVWLVDDGADEIVYKIASNRKQRYLLAAAQEEEINKIILEERL